MDHLLILPSEEEIGNEKITMTILIHLIKYVLVLVMLVTVDREVFD